MLNVDGFAACLLSEASGAFFFFLSPLHAFGTDVSVLRFSDFMDAGKWEDAKAVSSNYLVLD